MPRNVELKARARDLARAQRVAERLSGGAGRALTQTDTFLRAPRGRLKLRDFGDGRGQLIFYERPDSEGPKLSHYSISPTADPAGLVELDLLLITSGAQRCLQCQGRQEACCCTADQKLSEAVLSQALGVQGVVKKERRLYVVGQTRVHLDRVEGLGDFLELEVVLSEQQSPEDGERVARRLMEELGVQEEDLVSGAYLDLLLAEGSPT